MTWHLIVIPAAEELCSEYARVQASDNMSKDRILLGTRLRRFMVMTIAFVGLITGLQLVFADAGEFGQRRVAEVNLSDRRTLCRDCAQEPRDIHPNEGTSNDSPPITSVH